RRRKPLVLTFPLSLWALSKRFSSRCWASLSWSFISTANLNCLHTGSQLYALVKARRFAKRSELCSSAKRKSHRHDLLRAIPRALAQSRVQAWYKRPRRMPNIPRTRSVAARSARYVHLERQKTRVANELRQRRQHSPERKQATTARG